MDLSGLQVRLWRHLSGSTWAHVGDLSTWTALSAELRHLSVGPWAMTLPYDAQAAKVTKRHLVTVDFNGQRFTGCVEHLGPKSNENGGTDLELSGPDALTLLGDALIWPNPAVAWSNDGLATQDVAHYTDSGVAEDVLTRVITANMVTRRGDGLVVAPSLHRGKSIKVNQRFGNLLALVLGKAQYAGLGIRVGLEGTGTRADLTCRFYQPQDRSLRVRLSSKVGTLASWSQADDAPTATRIITGGGGKGTQRVFRMVVDDSAESEWARRREVFSDARDTTDTDDLDERGQEDLDQAAAQSAFSLEAVDAEGMKYGDHYTVGDTVTVELPTGLSTTAVLSAATVAADGDTGTLTLKPGNPDTGTAAFTQAQILRSLRTELRRLQQEES